MDPMVTDITANGFLVGLAGMQDLRTYSTRLLQSHTEDTNLVIKIQDVSKTGFTNFQKKNLFFPFFHSVRFCNQTIKYRLLFYKLCSFRNLIIKKIKL